MKLRFFVRDADINDCSLIRSLAARIWEPTYGNILPPDQLKYMFEMMYSVENIRRQMTDEGHQYFILNANDEPAGYLSIEQHSVNVYIFQKVYVVPELHGCGAGRYLFEYGVYFLMNIHHGVFTIKLYVNRNNPAVGFYERLGMKKSATRDHPIGNGYFMNDYVMSLKIRNC